jgi:hypothetical protein
MTEVILETDLTPDAARALTNRIVQNFGQALDDLALAYQGRAWVALGHASWDAYLNAELGEVRPNLPREQRREVVAQLRQVGMSTRAIGAALGVGNKTVHRDLGPVSDDTPGSVVGTDGKTYQPPKPKPIVDPAPGPDEPEIVEAELVEDDEPPTDNRKPRQRERAAWVLAHIGQAADLARELNTGVISPGMFSADEWQEVVSRADRAATEFAKFRRTHNRKEAR